MRPTTLLLAATVLAPAIAGAQILPPMDGYTVEVSFSEGLERRMDSINGVERGFEKQFRDNRHYREARLTSGTQRFADSDTAGTEWAGERLIGDPEDFTLENLVKAMVAYNVNRATPDFQGRIDVEIRRIGLSNPPIAFMERVRPYAAGRVTVTLPDGSALFDAPVSANFVVDPVADLSHVGPELAFTELDPPKRVGPTLAHFVERGLERVWPERASEIVGPVVIRVSDPSDRVVQSNFQMR